MKPEGDMGHSGENNQEITNELKTFERLSLTVQMVMVVVTCAYIIFAGLQWHVMSRQLRMMQIGERAWLVPFDLASEPSGSGAIFKVLFKNTGKTPGIDVSAWINRTASLSNIAAVDPVSSNRLAGLFAPNAIGHTSTANIPINIKDAEAIKQGISLYIYGTIRYSDIFKTPHWTQFCYVPSADLKSFEFCPTHNACDDCEPSKAK